LLHFFDPSTKKSPQPWALIRDLLVTAPLKFGTLRVTIQLCAIIFLFICIATKLNVIHCSRPQYVLSMINFKTLKLKLKLKSKFYNHCFFREPITKLPSNFLHCRRQDCLGNLDSCKLDIGDIFRLLSLCLSVSLSLCLSVSQFLCLSVSMSLSFYVSQFLCLSVS
jgi:hypothetical protein